MDPRIETVLDECRFRSCDPGYAGLQALAGAEFTGAVTCDGTTGFMVNGRLIGLNGGSIEAFWSSEFSALEADDPGLPMLCAMLCREGEVQGEYYTGETPIAEVDETLSSGSFTGYLQLSENVFSGDYFCVYYGGRSFYIAFLGTEDRVVTGPEAKERAGDEVGIFEVKRVDISVLDIPEADVDDSANAQIEEPPSEEQPQDLESETSPEPAATAPSPVEAPPAGPREPSREPESPSSDVIKLAEAAMASGGNTTAAPTTTIEQLADDDWIAIPSLDPARSSEPEPSAAPDTEPATRNEQPEPEPQPQPSPPTADLEAALEEAERENQRLRERIDELEQEILTLEAAAATENQGLAPAKALDGTNLFVRYRTTSGTTLESAMDGDRSGLADNLRVEWHTKFETEDASVDDEPFDSFLEGRVEYRFSEWLLTELPFELDETGRARGFAGLLEAIPEIDRIELRGDVPIHSRDGEERRSETFQFDLVFRNGMGDPLLVGQIHDDRSPTEQPAVETTLEQATAVATERATFQGAFFVTQSFFEPGALEAVADATGGGFFRGSSKESYVSVSRKRGFHLCLIEARDQTFHLQTLEG